MATEVRLPFDDPPSPLETMIARDKSSRDFAIDPGQNVVLEASAGTGKTHVLVTRYINLLRAGVDPANILAITFTRKAAAEMRERIVSGLRELAQKSPTDEARWRALRDRLGDISISTIDAFCFALLREFPLEADLDPGFDIADETVMPRLVDDALDGTLRVARRLAGSDPDVALLMASLGERRVRSGLSGLVDRRLSAGLMLRRFLGGSQAPTPPEAILRFAGRVRDAITSAADDVESFIADGPIAHDTYPLLAADLRALEPGSERLSPTFTARAVLDRLCRYFLTDKDTGRTRPREARDQYASPAAYTRHARAVKSISPHVEAALAEFERDCNVAMVRASWRLFRVARWRYRRALETQSLVDFPEGLSRSLHLLRQMDEFAQSRYRLEARYHHVLVDEFQDTNASQWKLVAHLIESWGEGIGLAHDGPLQPSIFIVGDRKQSIYAFRDADVRILRRAGRYISALRPAGRVRRSIARSFRAAPELLRFTNDLFLSIDTSVARADAFRYTERDRFPIETPPAADQRLAVIATATTDAAANTIADEIARLLESGVVHDRQTKALRAARPGDIAILFRSRQTHREIEAALDARGIPTYVYKGLGFFDADEVKDLVALLRFLANPASALRTAAFVRSRFVRLSDPAVRLLGEHLVAVIGGHEPVPGELEEEDRTVLDRLRLSLDQWLPMVDRVPPAELLDRVIDETAYAFELHGPRVVQARENLKKIRAITRRLQNRGYSTMARIADHLDRLSAGDESNAVVDALDAVNLMTVHAAKGLEFPIVFVSHLTRGTGGRGDPIVMVPGGVGGRPLISVGGKMPEADDAVRARDREETKRLLYVAVTRARDRLYLAAVLKDGKFSPGSGSLGEVLPPSLRDLFVAALGGAPAVDWQAESGGRHALRVTAPAPPSTTPRIEEAAAEERPTDFGPLADTARVRYVGAAEWAIEGCGGIVHRDGDRARPRTTAVDPAIVGTLIHRLFQAAEGRADADAGWLERRARAFLAGHEASEYTDADAVVKEAVAAFESLRQRPDVAALLDGAVCHYEVPFSARLPQDAGEDGAGQVVVIRGSIDCVAMHPDGSATILELKTGRPLSWHRAQIDIYLRAARCLFPATRVEGRLIYLDEIS